MKVSREQATENREKILSAAAALFRERGFEGISVADLMKQVGLTHGGFYGHFKSKEDLMAQACTYAFEEKRRAWNAPLARKSEQPLVDFANGYLTKQHRDNPDNGCVIAALAVDATRQGPAVRRAVTEGLKQQIEMMSLMVTGKTAAIRRDKALAAYASLIGALILSRAVDESDLSADFLRAVQEAVIESA
ncbi:MAG: TetR/AcrR family transcriptional regulator [Pseudomonadota bacterium]